MDKQELKNCPFCGERAQVNVQYDDIFYVLCLGCEAESPPKNSKGLAIKAWNTRVVQLNAPASVNK